MDMDIGVDDDLEAVRALSISDELADLPGAISFDDLKRRVPWHLKGEPYEVQLAAQFKARGERGFAWFLEQGLGKTALGLNEFVDLLIQDQVDIMIVLAPPTFLLDWQVAVKQWMVEPVDCYVWPQNPLAPKGPHRPGRRTEKLPPAKGPFLFAINWEMVRTAVGKKVIADLCAKFRVFMVEDETSYIKNHTSNTAKNSIEVAKDATVLRGLNGTPLTQSFLDIYPQYRALRLWNGVNFYSWRNKYAKKGGFMGTQIIGVKENMVEGFKRSITPHCFRALKKDWAKHLPPKIYNTRNYAMTREQAEAYYSMQEEFWVNIGGADIEVDMAITQRMKLQQIASGFAMDENGVAHRIMPADENPKLLALLQDVSLIKQRQGKFLVPRHFQESGELLMEAFEAQGYKVLHLRGGMGDQELVDLKSRFNDDDDIDGMVLSLHAGRMGHTLLGSKRRRCADELFFENSYNLLSRLQIEDRNHRHGQDAALCRYLDYAGTPAERDIAEALQKKIDMSDVLINSLRALPGA
jgi:hypothetical protein